MNAAIRSTVRERAANRCEYCQIHQDDHTLKFHVEHVRARQHGGSDDLDNLALACSHCNLHNGPNLVSVDPLTGETVPIFNPRVESWTRHFYWDGPYVCGLTPIGRATLNLLQMNAEYRIRLRAATKLTPQ